MLPSATPVPVVKVFVNGAVREPGVYEVARGDRLEQVVALAGGLTADADQTRLNLSLAVADQDHFYIPKVGDTPPTPSPGSTLIDINHASTLELQTLPGIAEKKAADIVAYREANGPFARVEDLLKVDGIGSKTLENLREFIAVP